MSMVDLKLKIPEGFLEEEVRWGYTVSRKMKEVWAVELDLLAEFDRVCKKHGLKYIASGGTMLGAVRHKGFIPWDDDIDVMMLRDDYEKLLTIAHDEFENPYFFLTTTRDSDFLRGYCKLCNSDTTAILKSQEHMGYRFNQGIFIDIFPLDKVSDNKMKFKWQVFQADCLLKIIWKCQKYQYGIEINNNNVETLKGKIVDLMYQLFHGCCPKMFDCSFYIENFKKICCRYNTEQTQYLSLISFQPGNRIHDILRSDMDNIIDSDFEFLSIPIPANYDNHLKRKYGGYTVPVNTGGYHGDVFFDTDKSYRLYIGEKI